MVFTRLQEPDTETALPSDFRGDYTTMEVTGSLLLGGYFFLPGASGVSTNETLPGLPGSIERFSQYFRDLDNLDTLPANWNSYGAVPPNNWAISWTREALRILVDMNFAPTKVLPSAEGGVGVSFVAEKKYADIECLNSQEILAVISERENRPTVWQVLPDKEDITCALERIRDFIQS